MVSIKRDEELNNDDLLNLEESDDQDKLQLYMKIIFMKIN